MLEFDPMEAHALPSRSAPITSTGNNLFSGKEKQATTIKMISRPKPHTKDERQTCCHPNSQRNLSEADGRSADSRLKVGSSGRQLSKSEERRRPETRMTKQRPRRRGALQSIGRSLLALLAIMMLMVSGQMSSNSLAEATWQNQRQPPQRRSISGEFHSVALAD